MLMNDNIIFDRYYCIKFAQTKEIMVHYILQPRHIFICIKAFILLLVISTRFAWRPVMSINKCRV